MSMKPRKTVYKGIEMRSRLEAGFAAWLDQRKVRWEYEPCAFATPDGQYLPDFRVELASGRAYIEVKPKQPDEGRLSQLLLTQSIAAPELGKLARKMAVIWDSEPDATLILIWPGMPEAFSDSVWDGCDLLELVPRWMGEDDDESMPGYWAGARWLTSNRTNVLWVGDVIDPMLEPWQPGYWEVK